MTRNRFYLLLFSMAASGMAYMRFALFIIRRIMRMG